MIRPGTVVTVPELMRIHLTSDFIKRAAIAIVAAGDGTRHIPETHRGARLPMGLVGVRQNGRDARAFLLRA